MTLDAPARRILTALNGERIIGSTKVPNPEIRLAKALAMGRFTARRHLIRLQELGAITLSLGPRRQIEHCFIHQESETPDASVGTPSPWDGNDTLPRERPAAPSLSAGIARIAVLVDVSNIATQFLKSGRTVCFARLREHTRGFGDIGFCDAFVAPTATDTDIAALWHAGFEVIACPRGSKDKDAVDEKMKMRALKYLFLTGISRIVIISRDADFQPLIAVAADLGKSVELVGIADGQMEALSGANETIHYEHSRQVERYLEALRLLRLKRAGEGRPDTDFMTHLTSLVHHCFRGASRPLHTKDLETRVKDRIYRKWAPKYVIHDISAGIRALVSSGALVFSKGGTRLNAHDALWHHVP